MLTDTACRNAKPSEKPRKLADSGGLYLLISPTGSRLWRCDYRLDGKRRTASFGAYPAVSLASARAERDKLKERLAAHVDPAQAKREDKRARLERAGNSLEAITRDWFKVKGDQWVSGYAARIMSRLEADIFPPLGKRPLTEIEAPEILDAIRKVEARGAKEIARRELQTLGQVFRYAIATGRARRDPTQDLRGALAARPRVKRRTALPREDLPAFLKALDGYNGEPSTRLALRLIILTLVRTGELRAARWTEFEDLDGDAPLWRIPAERMKMGTEHLVPLAPETIAVLRELRQYTGRSAFLFPSKGKEGFMSNNTMIYAIYRLGWHGRATTHGFRAVASTWLNEAGFNSDWIERQLAHDERNEVRGAYNAAQYLAGRREMMGAWAGFIKGQMGLVHHAPPQLTDRSNQ